MDSKKDNDMSAKSLGASIFLGEDSAVVLMSKKAEKLVSALYMIVKFIPENDPLSEVLKRQGVHLLSFITRAAVSRSIGSPDVCLEVRTLVLEIVSLLGVAHMSGSVSDMNYALIVKEFTNLVELFEKNKNSSSSLSFPREMFEVNIQGATNTTGFSNLHLQKQGSTYSQVKDNNLSFNKKTNNVLNKELSVSGTEKKQDRSELILNVFKKEKRTLGVKDVAVFVTDCSEKTIQRELLSLVARGVLRKEGERRWSKYTLS